MSKTDDQLNELLNIDTEIKSESTQVIKKVKTDRSANVETDYKYCFTSPAGTGDSTFCFRYAAR